MSTASSQQSPSPSPSKAVSAKARAPHGIDIHVDLRDAPKAIAHARLRIAAAPGPLSLLYPKWIPGTHWPSGPIANLTGLRFHAGGRELRWRRDPYDVYRFLLDVPPDADHVTVQLDYLGVGFGASHGGNSAEMGNDRLTVLSWHTVLLYPQDAVAADVPVNASISLPEAWDYATSLAAVSRSGSDVRFAPTSLATLVDSPVLAGRHFASMALTADTDPEVPPHGMQIAADCPQEMHVPPDVLAGLSRLPLEARALFGGFAFQRYDFLVALSDHFRTGNMSGLEHTSSSDNRGPLESFAEGPLRYNVGLVLPHEYVHAWNGKLHIPSGEAVANFNTPIRTDEVWVSEGLTMYWGEVLSVRSGLWSRRTFLEQLAYRVAQLQHQAGRSWRNLQDVATGQEALMTAKSRGASWRRDEDYYSEGALLWLEADMRIRTLSAGCRSLDDFARELFGGLRPGQPPDPIPYSVADVEAALKRVVSADWQSFLTTRLEETGRPVSQVLDLAGWRLDYADRPTGVISDVDSARQQLNAEFSVGIVVRASGEIADVLWGSAADEAGLTGGLIIRRVNGEPFDPRALESALHQTSGERDAVELRVDDAGQQRDVVIAYRGGPRYPVLVRAASTHDALADILRSRCE